MEDVISLGAGCFWGVEHAFKQLNGVVKTQCGYQGGKIDNPTYEQICRSDTGHAEVVKISFDPSIVNLSRVLDAFFFMHDPTQLNKQGNDIGTQYRSVIFPKDSQQESQIREDLERRKKQDPNIVTSIEPWGEFYSAENYHQDYLIHNPGGYCHIGLEVFQKIKTNQF